MVSLGDGSTFQAIGFLVLIILIAIGLLWIAPIVTFWAIGVLFGHHIPLTWGTWFAFWGIKLFALTGAGVRRNS